MLTQPLQAVGMALGWTGMVEHLWVVFPNDVMTAAFGMLASFHWVGPGIVANVAGGESKI